MNLAFVSFGRSCPALRSTFSRSPAIRWQRWVSRAEAADKPAQQGKRRGRELSTPAPALSSLGGLSLVRHGHVGNVPTGPSIPRHLPANPAILGPIVPACLGVDIDRVRVSLIGAADAMAHLP